MMVILEFVSTCVVLIKLLLEKITLYRQWLNYIIPKFGKAKVFSKLDIKVAFHQIEISGACKDITTFITSKGLFRYKCLMFGISCAPEYLKKKIRTRSITL